MGKENRRPPVSRFLFIITPLFPHCTPLSACVLCVLVGLYPSRLLRLDVFTTIQQSQIYVIDTGHGIRLSLRDTGYD